MIAQCPRCATPRQGDRPFCQTCGFDYNSVQAAPPPQPPADATPPPFEATPPGPPPVTPPTPPESPFGQPPAFGQTQPFGPTQPFGQPSPFSQPAQVPQAPYVQPPNYAAQSPQAPQPPSVCPRCNAPLYPGYQVCSNCGLDMRQAFGPALMAPLAAASRPKKSNTPMLVAAAGLVLVIAAGGYFIATRNSGSNSPTPKPTPSLVAQGTPSDSPTTDTPEPTIEATDTPEAGATPTDLAIATVEPAPTGTWTTYTATDGTWSAKFPGKAAPTKQDTSTGTGSTAMKMVFYYTLDMTSGGAGYFVYTVDASSFLNGMSAQAFLDFMGNNMSQAMSGASGVVESTTDTTIAKNPAKKIMIQASGQEITLFLTVIKNRMYMLMTSAVPGATVYPQYFVNSFAVK